MGKSKHKVGNKYKTNEGYTIEIVEYTNSSNVIVQFESEWKNKIRVNTAELVTGRIKNPMHKSVFGHGYYGVGPYKATENGKSTKIYNLWKNIIRRCYNEDFKEKNISYQNCTLYDEWHNFQIFAEWCQTQVGYDIEDWQIDKDLLVKGNKEYGPYTCIFVPREINSFLANKKKSNTSGSIGVRRHNINDTYVVNCSYESEYQYIGSFNDKHSAEKIYEMFKCSEAKRLAEKWKEQIDNKAYVALMCYSV